MLRFIMAEANDNTNITLMMTMVIVTLSKVDCEGGTWTGKVEH